MRPWNIDAGEMDVTDLLGFQSNLLHPNPEIRDFLKQDNRSTTIIIAPKGFGKTLLLKAKRVSHKDGPSKLLPIGALVDKPSGRPKTTDIKSFEVLRKNDDY